MAVRPFRIGSCEMAFSAALGLRRAEFASMMATRRRSELVQLALEARRASKMP